MHVRRAGGTDNADTRVVNGRNYRIATFSLPFRYLDNGFSMIYTCYNESVAKNGRAFSLRGGHMKDWARGFYTSQAWITNSKAYIASQRGECERCRAAGIEGSVAKIAHHKIYLTRENIHDPHITMAWDNLEALCQDCHNKEHHRKNKKRCYYFDKRGNMHKA